jgi:amino acid transporter
MASCLKITSVIFIADKIYERLCAICSEISVCRMCFVGARYGHFPAMLSHISINSYTPTPSLVFLVCTFSITHTQNVIFFSDRIDFK